MNNFSITDESKSNPEISGLLFNRIKEDILGKDFSLSLVFIDEMYSQKLNKEHRGKDKPTNVLAFPLDESEGEIYICPSCAAKEHDAFGYSKDGFLAYLFIHACLHLKGYTHGSTMEAEERKISLKFNVS